MTEYIQLQQIPVNRTNFSICSALKLRYILLSIAVFIFTVYIWLGMKLGPTLNDGANHCEYPINVTARALKMYSKSDQEKMWFNWKMTNTEKFPLSFYQDSNKIKKILFLTDLFSR